MSLRIPLKLLFCLIALQVNMITMAQTWTAVSPVDSVVSLLGTSMQGSYCYTTGILLGGFGSDGVIHRSADTGQTWQRVLTVKDSGANTEIYALDFWNDSTGIAVGNEPYYDSSLLTWRAQIWRTEDYGKTWFAMDPFLDSVAMGRAFLNVHCPDPNALFAVACGEDGLMAYSYDGGLTWTRSSIPDSVSSANGLHFYDARSGMVCNMAGSIYRTEDSGQTWSLVHFSAEFLYDIHFNGALGSCGASSSTVYSSSDSGRNWTVNINLEMTHHRAVQVLCAEDRRMAGNEGDKVLFSADSNASHVPHFVSGGSSGDIINDMDFLGDLGIAVGTNGYVIIGEGNNCGTGTGLLEAQNNRLNLFPNPGKDYLFIEHTGSPNFEIFDMAGTKIADNQDLIHSSTQTHINTKNWNQGMYIIRFMDGKSLKWIKF